jgi:glycosyltransferase involved in cell wall biosynthesis
VKVLSIPCKSADNAYFDMFAKALADDGIEVVCVRSFAAFRLRFDVLHIHFPDFFYHRRNVAAAVAWSALFLAVLLFIRVLGKRVVYSVHDVNPVLSTYHRAWLAGPYIRMFHQLCDAFVFLSRTSQEEFYSRFPGNTEKTCSLITHPPYPVVLMDPAERTNARKALKGGDNAFLVGVLGVIKPYKGLETIAALPTHLPNGQNLLLVVAGPIERAFQTNAQRLLDSFTGRLLRIDERLSDTALDELIQCMDVVLLPYRSISNSGFALLALSNRARIVASDLPLFRELQADVGEPWIYCHAATPGDLAQSVSHQIFRVAAEPVTEADEAKLTRYLQDISFAATAHTFRKLYERVVPAARVKPARPVPTGFDH